MTTWDIEGLFHNVNVEELRQSISEQTFEELIVVYMELSNAVNTFLRFCEIPVVAYILSDLAHAYSFEITNRYMQSFNDSDNFRMSALHHESFRK